MLLSGINVGASSGKLCAFLSGNQADNTHMRYSNDESPVKFLQTAQAGQPPGGWWQQVPHAPGLFNKKGGYQPKNIFAVGVIYSTQQPVWEDKEQKILRDSIIWRAYASFGLTPGQYAVHNAGKQQ
jgi:xylulokinase